MESGSRTFQLIAVSPGIAIGRVMKIAGPGSVAPERIDIAPEKVEQEIARYHRAAEITVKQLSRLQTELRKKLNNSDADIFEAHLLLAQDKALVGEIEKRIRRELCNAEYALYEAVEHFVKVFSAIKDEYLRERALDLRDVGLRLMDNLSEAAEASLGIDDRRVIVSTTLTPTETARLDTAHVLGFVLESGSVTSHTAILARSLNLPAVVGLPAAEMRKLSAADKIIIDGYSGKVIVNPDPRTEEAYRLKAQTTGELLNRLQSDKALPPETVDGFEFPLEINLDTGAGDFSRLRTSGVSGVGLFRTEFIFMNPQHRPLEEEQFEIYKKVLIAAGDMPVTIRTFDIGGDKSAAGVPLFNEANPFLGLRGIRLALKERKNLFEPQLRALLRAGVYGNLRIMLPMISSVSEMEETRSIMEKLSSQLDSAGVEHARHIPLGAMIETPAAALVAEDLGKCSDFFSIGTNDLVQYTRAIDRSNERVSYLYRPAHPAVLKLIKATVEGAKKNGLPVGVCGQMASDPAMALLLIGLGVHTLSMVEQAIPLVRRAIRSVSLYEAEELTKKAICCFRSEDAEALANELLKKGAPELVEI